MIVSHIGLDELLLRMGDHSLGMQGLRVLMTCARHADHTNQVRLGQKELALRLGMKQPAVSRALRELVDIGLMDPPTTARGRYRISPRLLWKGSAKTLKQALAA